jgi:hypothetical protein
MTVIFKCALKLSCLFWPSRPISGRVTGRPNQPPGNRIALVEHVCCPDQQYTGLSMINLNELPDLIPGPARRNPLGRGDSLAWTLNGCAEEFDRLERALSLSWDQPFARQDWPSAASGSPIRPRTASSVCRSSLWRCLSALPPGLPTG